MIVTGAAALAAVAVVVWLLTRSDGSRGVFTYYAPNAQEAVADTCHAESTSLKPTNRFADPGHAYALMVRKPAIAIYWIPKGESREWAAVVRPTDSGFKVVKCKAALLP
jgi:hypothetical protein